MPDAVKAVLHKRHFHWKPAAAVRFDGLFCIIPHQPDAVAVVRLSPQLIGNLQQHPAGGSAIVGTDVGGVTERIIRVVVAGDDDDAIFRTGEFADDVVNRYLPSGVGGEDVVVDRFGFEIGEEVVLLCPRHHLASRVIRSL